MTPIVPREAYFEALAEIAAGRQLSDKEWTDLCIRHDNYFYLTDRLNSDG